MNKKISIDPVTRLEGHGKIEIFLDNQGEVERAFFQIPELRGFEKFVEGRPVEDMPQITSRICGVCPTAHHMAATKALDNLYGVAPTRTARLIREIFYNLFMFEDHLLHFYFLGGPDFIVGPDAPKEKRNILGVIETVGMETGKKVIAIRKQCRHLMEQMGGKVIHPVLGLPGGVAKGITSDLKSELNSFAKTATQFAEFTLLIFDKIVLHNPEYMQLIASDIYAHKTYYMGLVDEHNQPNFYDGQLRVVDPEGKEISKADPASYLDLVAEHVEPWSYIKFPYLKEIGWKGFVDGKESGVYRVAPLARLNVADKMATKTAQAEYERFYTALGKKPVHQTLAIHWARLIEVMQAAETIEHLVQDEELCSPAIRNMALQTPKEGIGVVEAPRGTLIHHYKTDAQGKVKSANLIVASQNNAAGMSLSIEKAAKQLIHKGKVNDGLLNKIEMAFRAYDPCFGCATHSQPGKMPMEVNLRLKDGQLHKTIIRDWQGIIHHS
jgi:F420-non-reducing hydrogenase large subunit